MYYHAHHSGRGDVMVTARPLYI